MPTFVLLAFLAHLWVLPRLASSANECYSCMTCNDGSEAIFDASFAPLGTTNGVEDYTMVPAFPEAETNCPTNTSETPEKMTLKLPGSQCLKGYWTYKNSAGAVLLSCVAAIPLEDLFEAAGDVNLTDSELKSKLSMLNADGMKTDFMELLSAADKMNTASLDAMFTICTDDNCNTLPTNDKFEASVGMGAYDAAKLQNKKDLLKSICDRMVSSTAGATGHECMVDSAGERADAAGSRSRRSVADDKGVIVIITSPGTGYTTAVIATTYATAVTVVKSTTSDAELTALLSDFETTATFEKTEGMDESFANQLLFPHIWLIICFAFRVLQ